MQQVNWHSRQITIALLACVAAMPSAIGCEQSDTGKVYGRVTVGGKTITHGLIVFQGPSPDVAVIATLQADGSYNVATSRKAGLSPGGYKVAIQPQVISLGQPPLVTLPQQQKKTDQSPIPAKYHNVATSGLKITVQRGDNPPFDFDLSR